MVYHLAMRQLIYDPSRSGPKMKIACFVSGSGTNYEKIAEKNPNHRYLVVTNRSESGGAAIARRNGHDLLVLSHVPYLKEARKKYGAGKVPRNCPEREQYEKDLLRMIEERFEGRPDLICLAGFDQWTSDWMVNQCYPRMLNVHPGDTTRGYSGLGWIPSAKAILAGEHTVRSTLFFVDGTEDNGPVLLQSRPLPIRATIASAEGGMPGLLLDELRHLEPYKGMEFDSFMASANDDHKALMKRICERLQRKLKEEGDWEIYPFGVGMIAQGTVEIDGRSIYIRGELMPKGGLQI
jgi:phosphoribosylglycinamide formyltransferase 1